MGLGHTRVGPKASSLGSDASPNFWRRGCRAIRRDVG
jgi:hypothetical protein